MKCNYCKKKITDISSSFIKDNKYYHNKLCYLDSITRDYNKKINDLLKYYYSFNDNNCVVPKQYYIMFNKLKKSMENKYVLYFLYNSREVIYTINSRYKYNSNKRMYKVWEYFKINFYSMYAEYTKEKTDLSHIFQYENKEVKTKVRKKNKLLE